MKLKNKTAFITGGGGHIGFYTAKKLAEEGAKVFLCDINNETVENAINRLKEAGYEANGAPADVKSSVSIEEVMKTAYNTYGSIDIMIHCAGGSARGNINPLADQTDDVIENVLGVNLFGALYTSRASARYMIAQKGGRIINLSSIIGVQGGRNCTEYSAAKGGIIAMTKSLAKELGEYNITVNCVSPGIVKRPEETRDISGTNFLGRDCAAEDVANLIAFLASEEASYITGQNYIIDGGRSLALKGTD